MTQMLHKAYEIEWDPTVQEAFMRAVLTGSNLGEAAVAYGEGCAYRVLAHEHLKRGCVPQVRVMEPVRDTADSELQYERHANPFFHRFRQSFS